MQPRHSRKLWCYRHPIQVSVTVLPWSPRDQIIKRIKKSIKCDRSRYDEIWRRSYIAWKYGSVSVMAHMTLPDEKGTAFSCHTSFKRPFWWKWCHIFLITLFNEPSDETHAAFSFVILLSRDPLTRDMPHFFCHVSFKRSFPVILFLYRSCVCLIFVFKVIHRRLKAGYRRNADVNMRVLASELLGLTGGDEVLYGRACLTVDPSPVPPWVCLIATHRRLSYEQGPPRPLSAQTRVLW